MKALVLCLGLLSASTLWAGDIPFTEYAPADALGFFTEDQGSYLIFRGSNNTGSKLFLRQLDECWVTEEYTPNGLTESTCRDKDRRLMPTTVQDVERILDMPAPTPGEGIARCMEGQHLAICRLSRPGKAHLYLMIIHHQGQRVISTLKPAADLTD